ncbi:MAG: DUF2391 domain-containing protein [Halococcoides sp.]
MVRPPRYRIADTAQQIVGGFLLAGPFVVTEEVWSLAETMTWLHGAAAVVLVAAIGYGALYSADDDRDPDAEAELAGVPIRFVSLMVVSFGSVTVLATLLAAPEHFLADLPVDQHLPVMARAISIGAIFSVVGAATADSVF